MKTVITYGTFDLLHQGHINLLKRAKELGDYLIVGVTADDFDKRRGKINVTQSLIDRVEAVKATGIADKIIVEEYDGQKIDDVKKYNVDIFTVGTDWVGRFDYLSNLCKVVYLPRTEGISSSDERAANRALRFGLVGESQIAQKMFREASFINGLKVTGVYAEDTSKFSDELKELLWNGSYGKFLNEVDAVFIVSPPDRRYEYISSALKQRKHVLCESPIALSVEKCEKLFKLAEENHCILMESIKTAYSVSYYRLLLLSKIGEIGKIVSVDSTCTSLIDPKVKNLRYEEKGIYSWGPTALLPVFQLLGNDYKSKSIVVGYLNSEERFDGFTNIHLIYDNAVANVKVGRGVKAEGELIIAGTKGYIYVPAPWWKTDYFEIRFENPANNKRVFYQLDGEGIRNELITFVKSIESEKDLSYISKSTTLAIVQILECFEKNKHLTTIDIN